MAIHPAQLAPIAAALAPDEATTGWARRVLAAAVEGEGATRVDGAMVDRPVVERARAVLAALGEGAAPAPATAVHRKGRKGDARC
jgi:citrate lyase subunit beta/citryl-CoA lyase